MNKTLSCLGIVALHSVLACSGSPDTTEGNSSSAEVAVPANESGGALSPDRITHTFCLAQAQALSTANDTGKVVLTYFYTTQDYTRVEVYRVDGGSSDEAIVASLPNGSSTCSLVVDPHWQL